MFSGHGYPSWRTGRARALRVRLATDTFGCVLSRATAASTPTPATDANSAVSKGTADNSFFGRVSKCAEAILPVVHELQFKQLSPNGYFTKMQLARMSAITAAKFVLSVSASVPVDVSVLVGNNFYISSPLDARTELWIFARFNFGYICGDIDTDKTTTYNSVILDLTSPEVMGEYIRGAIIKISNHLNEADVSSFGDVPCCAVDQSRVYTGKETILWEMGKGRHGSVYLVRLGGRFGSFKAAKKITLGHTRGLSMSVIREVCLMVEMDHQNIASLFQVGVGESESCQGSGPCSLCIYMEPMLELKLLLDSLECSGGLVEQFVLPVVRQIMLGVAYLHSMNVVHRDLKPQNILCSNDGNIKIADLGLSRYTDGGNPGHMNTAVCAPYYRPPELLSPSAKTYDTSVDMWSVGCTLYEVATNRVLFPFTSTLATDQMRVIAGRLGPPPPGLQGKHVDSISQEANSDELLHRVFQTPSCRLSEQTRSSLLSLLAGLITYAPGSRLSAQACLNRYMFLRVKDALSDPWSRDYVLRHIFGEKYFFEAKLKWDQARPEIARLQ